MTEEVEVSLVDGTTRTLSQQALDTAAESLEPMAEGQDDRAEANWAGTRYDALELVTKALGIGEDLVRPGAALRALRTLAPDAEPEEQPAEAKPVPEPYDERPADDVQGAHGEDLSNDLTPDVYRQLQRLQGKWVAVRGGQVVVADETLVALLARVEGEPATVMYVPRKSERDNG